jgi:hypothetical protein
MNNQLSRNGWKVLQEIIGEEKTRGYFLMQT